MASNLRVDTILPSTGTSLGIGTASGSVTFLGDTNITTSGDVTIGGNLGIGGTLTYEDVTNIDSIGIITARSTVSIADSIIHTGDTDTSFRFSSADTITLNTGGVERLQINSQGKSTFNTPGGDDAFLVKGDNFTGVRIESARNDSSDHAMFQMLGSRGTNASPTILQSGDTIGTLSGRGYDGNSYAQSSNILFKVSTTPGDGDMPGKLEFQTSPDGSEGPSTRMIIDHNGHVTKPNNLCLQYTGTGDITSGDVIYATKVFDVGTSNAYNTSNGEFTAPVTGVYRIQYEHFASGAGRATAGILKHIGSCWSTVKNGMRVYSVSGGSNWASVPTIFYLQLNATEKFKIIHLEGTIHLNTPWNHMTVQLVQ